MTNPFLSGSRLMAVLRLLFYLAMFLPGAAPRYAQAQQPLLLYDYGQIIHLAGTPVSGQPRDTRISPWSILSDDIRVPYARMAFSDDDVIRITRIEFTREANIEGTIGTYRTTSWDEAYYAFDGAYSGGLIVPNLQTIQTIADPPGQTILDLVGTHDLTAILLDNFNTKDVHPARDDVNGIAAFFLGYGSSAGTFNFE